MGELPSWAAMYKKHSTEGFEIVGLECQGSTPAEISDLAKAKGVTYEITSGGNIKGSNVTGIPHAFLFGADGNLITDNGLHGPDLEKKVTLALKECGAALAGAGPYTKLAPLATQIKSGVGLGAILKTLTAKKASKDATEVAEATMMYDALHNGAQSQFDDAVEKKKDEPLAALLKFDRLALQFTGDELGKKAADQASTMRKDPQIKKELEGEQAWKVIEGWNDKLKPVKGIKDPKDPVFVKINMEALQGLVQGCRAIVQRCPNTKAAERAQAYIDNYVPAK